MKNILPEYEIDSYRSDRKAFPNSANFIGSFDKKVSKVLTRFVT